MKLGNTNSFIFFQKTIKMVRKYKRRSSKGTYEKTDMKKAIDLVAKRGSIRKVAN